MGSSQQSKYLKHSAAAGLFMDSNSAGISGQGRDMSLAVSREHWELKRLAFIPSYSAYYSRKVAALYRKSRSRLPTALQPRLDAVESRVSAVSLPVVQAMQIRSEHLLSSLDRKVGADAYAHTCCSCPPSDACWVSAAFLVLRGISGVPCTWTHQLLHRPFSSTR